MPYSRFIVGPPGTGKTTRAKEYVENLIASGTDPRKIALVSFTNAAAVTLQSRIAGMIPRNNIGTLHSFAFRAAGLQSDKIAELKIGEWNKDHKNYLLSTDQASANHPENDAPTDGPVEAEVADDLYNQMNILRARMVDRALWFPKIQNFAAKWEEWKADNQLIDFTDMIEIAWRDIEIMPGAPSVIVCDEAQDFSLLEIAVLIKWAAKAEVINWIGDPDQILYEFKGVAPSAFKTLIERADQLTVLSQSFRVPAAVHSVAMEWINRIIPDREKVEYQPTASAGAVIRNRNANFLNPAPLLECLETVLESRQTALIAASCSYMLNPTIQALRAAGIPFYNPNRKTRGDWNPLDASRGNTASDRILAYLRPDANVWGDDARFWKAGDLQKWVEVIQSDGVLIRGAKKKIDDLEPERELQISEFFEWFNEDQLDRLVALDTNWYKSVILPKKFKSFEFPFNIVEKRGAAELRKARQIKVGTIHSFKGDEADTVILFPDLSLKGMGEYENPKTRARVGRQFYVGITRAIDTLVLCGPAGNLAVKL